MSQASTDGSDLERVSLNVDRDSVAGNGSATPAAASAPEGRRRLSDRQKKVLAVALVVHVVVATFTWRDLRRRPAAQVRGPKVLWGVAATLNTSGSVLYWLVGRRRHVSAAS